MSSKRIFGLPAPNFDGLSSSVPKGFGDLASVTGARVARGLRRLPASAYASGADAILIIVLAFVLAKLTWVWLTPLPLPSFAAVRGPATQSTGAARPLLLDFDPFHRDEVVRKEEPLTAATPETTLDLKLYGVRAMENPSDGSAIIRLPNHDQRAFNVGMELLKGVTLAAVFPDRVVLSRRGTRETLSLDEDSAVRDAQGGGAATLARASSASPAAQDRRRQGANSGQPARGQSSRSQQRKAQGPPAAQAVPEDAVRVSYENGEALLEALALKPRIDGARLNGMYIQARGNAKLPANVGLADGDVLIAVNGTRLTSLNRLSKIKDRLEVGGPVALTIERDGEEKTVNLIVGTAS